METPHEDHSSAGGRLKSAVKNFGLKVGSKVAKSGFVRRAFDKVSSYPLVLTVVVNRLDGELAINIPPPTTDTIWYVLSYTHCWSSLNACSEQLNPRLVFRNVLHENTH